MIDHKTGVGKAFRPDLLPCTLAMVGRRWLLLAWCACAALLWFASNAHASVTISTRPGGFDVATEAAAERAGAWAAAGGGSLREVHSNDDFDDFDEVIAVIELPTTLPDNAVAQPGAAMLASAGDMLGQTAPPTDATANLDEDGNLTSLTGTWEDEASGNTYFVAMASSGPTHAVIVFAVRTDEALMYERAFDDVVAGIAGTSPPIARFDISKWRLAGVAGWALFTLLAWVIVWRRGEGMANASEQSRRVAAVCTIAAFVVLIVAWIVLGGMETELALDGLSREWAAAEVFLFGIAAAGIALAVGLVRSAQVQPIQSAPDAGAFGRLRNQAARAVPRRGEFVVPAGVDGPSRLSPADEGDSRDGDDDEDERPRPGRVISIVGGEAEFPPPTQPGGPPER